MQRDMGNWTNILKKGDEPTAQWFKHDDNKVYEISENNAIETISKYGIYFLYKKSNNQSILK